MGRCNFYVGQKVVCVDDSFADPELDGLRAGRVYTIRWIGQHPWHYQYPRVCVKLVEIVRDIHLFDEEEVGYRYTRFRPATDISSLEALLNSSPTPAKETCDA
jgi:hypothetical protein